MLYGITCGGYSVDEDDSETLIVSNASPAQQIEIPSGVTVKANISGSIREDMFSVLMYCLLFEKYRCWPSMFE